MFQFENMQKMDIHKLRETLLANWMNLICSFVDNQNILIRPYIEKPVIAKSIKKNLIEIINITTLQAEEQILREMVDLIKQLDNRNKYSTELKLNKTFLCYVSLLGKDDVKNYFGPSAESWENGIARIQEGTNILEKREEKRKKGFR